MIERVRGRLVGFAAIGLLAACSTAGPAPQTVEMKAAINGAGEVPPSGSAAQGYAFITFNSGTRGLEWKIYYAGMTATAAHFHGPADQKNNAGVVINLAPSGPPSSPITGSATLTEPQAAQLAAGKWYVNIHSQTHPGGEIRGQVVPEWRE